jgi:chromosome segregation ATPase
MSEELESRVSKLEAFAQDVRGYTQVLTEMIRRHDERLDTFDAALANLTVKVEALADAQIRTEETVQHLTERLDRYMSNGKG